MGEEVWFIGCQHQRHINIQARDWCCIRFMPESGSLKPCFNDVREIHELEMGNDHPKNKTLYKRVYAKYGKFIPWWICEMFQSSVLFAFVPRLEGNQKQVTNCY